MLVLFVAVAVGGATFAALHYATRPEPKWAINFPADDSRRWKTFNTQKPFERKPPSIAKHHAKWFVVPRDPAGESTRETQWYFIDGEDRRIVGPWKPKVAFRQHGFHPAGCYVGIEHAADDQDVVRVHVYDPVKAVGRILPIPRPRETRGGYEKIQLSTDCSTVAVAGVGMTKPLAVHVFDVDSGEKRHELIFPKAVGLLAGLRSYTLSLDETEPIPDTVVCSLSSTGRFLAVGSTSTGIDFIDTASGQACFSISEIPWKDGSLPLGTEAQPESVRFDVADRTATVTVRRDDTEYAVELFAAAIDLSTGALTEDITQAYYDLEGSWGDVVHSPDGRTTLKPARGWDEPSFPVTRHRPLSRLPSSEHGTEPDWTDAESASLDANGYLVHASPVPESDLVVANVLRTIPGRTPAIPFARPVLDYLDLDQVRPQTYDVHFLQLDFTTQETTQVRKLKTANPYSHTDVLVQPNRIGLLLQKTNHQVFEVWPLPRYEVTWPRPVAIAAAVFAFFGMALRLNRKPRPNASANESR